MRASPSGLVTAANGQELAQSKSGSCARPCAAVPRLDKIQLADSGVFTIRPVGLARDHIVAVVFVGSSSSFHSGGFAPSRWRTKKSYRL